MQTLPSNYVDLSRQFLPIPERATGEESALQSYAEAPEWLLRRNALGWGELFERNLVVVLGEPGSGKTYELQAQAALSTVDRPRFYLRLDELAVNGSQHTLTETDTERLNAWKSSSASAVFFLDSVDEAKIRHQSDFHRALDQFLGLIGRSALIRANVVISSRITEWLPTTDADALRIRFPRRGKLQSEGKGKSSSKDAYPYVVSLLPLSTEAVRTYTSARGLDGAQKFLDALDKAHAWELARRPADVNDLIAFWNSRGTLGTLTNVLDFVCESQLRKSLDRERIGTLATERAKSGAECLAAATLLCRKFIFQIPGEMNSSAEGIDATSCVPTDWRVEEVRSLLNHPLFDGASYGHIRFHHRRISEFLAARWFERLLMQGCPVGVLEDLLFAMAGAERELRPSFAPLAAWLCGGANRWNALICRRVLERAPEILLRFGDPTRLTVEDRRALLHALSQKANGREQLWWDHDEATLSRLAIPEIASDINDLITSKSCGQTLRELALRIAIAGKLSGCAPAVLVLAIDDLEEGQHFPLAAEALESIGTQSDLEGLAAAAKNVARLPQRVLVPLSKLLFPKVWSVSDFFRAFKLLVPASNLTLGWDSTLSDHLSSVASKENGSKLLAGLLGHPVDDHDEDDDFEPALSLQCALSIATMMLEWPILSDDEAALIGGTLVRAGDRRSHWNRQDDLAKRTERHPNVRRQYFLKAAQQVCQEHDRADDRLYVVMIYYNRIPPISGDLIWIVDWLGNAASDGERETATHWAFEVWSQTGRARTDYLKVKAAANRFPNTRILLRRLRHPGITARVKAFWYRRVRHWMYRHRFKEGWMAFKKPFLSLRGKWSRWWHRSKIRAGDYPDWLGLQTARASHRNDKYSLVDWSSLEKLVGAKCTAAIKEGCKRVWMLYQAPMPHERKPNEGLQYRTIAGLAGITLAWQQEELNFSSMSFEEAVRGTRYGLNELNGFPDWFDDLASMQSKAVHSTLADCISHEWMSPPHSEVPRLALGRLAWNKGAANELMKQFVLQRLNESQPENLQVLKEALRVVLSSPYPSSGQLAALAIRFSSAVPACAPCFSHWMALWLQVDADAAVGALESKLASAIDPITAMVLICEQLGSHYDPQPPLPNPSWLRPQALRRFIPLVYRYVNRKDDIDRSGGGGYSPTARDAAQQFRGGLLERMVECSSPEISDLLRQLLAEPNLSHLGDYIHHLLERQRGRLAEQASWTAKDVRTFAVEFEREPQTDADLFRIGMRRLVDLKSWVETGDDSPRNEVHPDNKEAGFRDWLRRRLNEVARNRYVVPPEWEIPGGRPDLRLVIPQAPPVSLELKIADERPLHDLLDGLEKQLVNTYLCDYRAHFGIYVIALFKRDRRWKPLSDGDLLTCDQMIAVLRDRAKEILATRPEILGLEVVLIHFSRQ